MLQWADIAELGRAAAIARSRSADIVSTGFDEPGVRKRRDEVGRCVRAAARPCGSPARAGTRLSAMRSSQGQRPDSAPLPAPMIEATFCSQRFAPSLARTRPRLDAQGSSRGIHTIDGHPRSTARSEYASCHGQCIGLVERPAPDQRKEYSRDKQSRVN